MFRFLRLASLLIAAFVVSPVAAASAPAAFDNPNGNTHVVCLGAPSQSYELYIPSTAPAVNAPILYGFDPGGNGKATLLQLAAAAETNGWMLAVSNNSKNGPWTDIFEAQDAVLQDTEARFNLHPTQRFAAGFSGGARASLALAFRYPAKICGVLGLGAGWPSNTDLHPTDDRLIVRLIIGTEDGNYTYDVPSTEGKLVLNGVRCVVDTFAGGHEWPPAAMVLHGAAWLNANAEVDPNEGIDAEACGAGSVFSQPATSPNGAWGASISDDYYGRATYERFDGVDGVVTGVTWWGIEAIFNSTAGYWLPRESPSEVFTINFYTDSGGLPGALAYMETVTATRTETPGLYNNNYRLYRYHTTLASPVPVETGWVSIVHDADATAVALWAAASEGDSYSVTRTGSGPFEPLPTDLAICLSEAPLEVSFTAAPTWGEPPHEVEFHAALVGDAGETVTWHWDFGDGGTSDEGPDTMHAYTAPGTYSVTVTATTSSRQAFSSRPGYIFTSASLPLSPKVVGLGLLAVGLAAVRVLRQRRAF